MQLQIVGRGKVSRSLDTIVSWWLRHCPPIGPLPVTLASDWLRLGQDTGRGIVPDLGQ